jgi:hypothetical protein
MCKDYSKKQKIRQIQCNAKTRKCNDKSKMKSNRYADANADAPNSKYASFPSQELLMCRLEKNLAVLVLVGITDSEARDTKSPLVLPLKDKFGRIPRERPTRTHPASCR